jgi:SAM-dependent methyltransferase
MEPKPAGWQARYGAAFTEQDVVARYHLRPPYPQEVIDTLARLAQDARVLDAGCGTGELARRIAPHVSAVDAVDVSPAMLAVARAGAPPNVTWIEGRVEDVELSPQYTLAVAGDSVHWFDWETALPRFAALLAHGAPLAIVQRSWIPDDLQALLVPVYRRHSWNTDFEPRDPVLELERRGLFVGEGTRVAEEPWRPTTDELVEVHFSTSGLARARLADPDRFAADLRAVIEDAARARGPRHDLQVRGAVTWGRPAPPRV